jgi:fatty-acyl-CoA synthase
MFNMAGEVIGIVSHNISKSGGSEGLGFVVTINTAKKLLLERKSFWSGIDGTMLTGDLAAMRPDGYFSFRGRAKDTIIRGGENIAPKEIEDLLRSNPKIVDVYVYGIPDERVGEEVAAAIKLKQGETATTDEIREFCNGRIARFKIPRQIRFVDSFPMTASGKVQKFKLREMHLARQSEESLETTEQG